MGTFKSIVTIKGKKDEVGEVIPIPELRVDKVTGLPSESDISAFEAAFLEPACETALSRGLLPNPEKPKKEGGYECFGVADVDALDAYRAKLKAKFKAREREDMKRRPLSQVVYA